VTRQSRSLTSARAPRLLFKLWFGRTHVDALLVAVIVLVAFANACPAPPAHGRGEGEGETAGEGEGADASEGEGASSEGEGEGSEGEGQGAGEGEGAAGEGEGEGTAGEGEGEGTAGEGEGEGVPSVALVPGAGLLLEDVARDGSELAYVDASGTLFAIAPGAVQGGNPGAPVTVSSSTQLAQYHGDFLVAFHALVAPANKVAATADVATIGTAGTSPLGNNVRVSSLSASDDGLHLYHEESPATGGRDVVLDGVNLANFTKVKSRFTPTNANLIVGANFHATLPSGATTTAKVVRAYSVANVAAGGFFNINNTLNDPTATPPVLGPSNETQVTHDGTQVIYGDHAQSNRVDITIVDVNGSSPVVLKQGGDDIVFKVTVDDSEVIYLVDTLTVDSATTPNPDCGAIEAVHRDGSQQRTIRVGDPTCATGAKDMKALSSKNLVYARAINGSLEDLGIVAVDGSSDLALGTGDVSLGFSKDGRFFAYLDGVAAGVGTLKVFDTAIATIISVSANVLVSPSPAFASSSKLVMLDATGVLREAVIGTTGGFVLIDLSSGVSSFGVVHDGLGLDASRVAFSRAADGIFFAGL
jgi:hypothetical protein